MIIHAESNKEKKVISCHVVTEHICKNCLHYHKSKILLFKPNIDTRDFAVVKTRNNKEVPAIIIDDLNQIYDYLEDKITTIFLDEANFIKGDISI